jgi:5-deoxy-glucuronate isomerase
LNQLRMALLDLDRGGTHAIETGDCEYAFVLIQGTCVGRLDSGLAAQLGPRPDPYEHLPYALLLSREESVTLEATEDTVIAIGCAPAPVKKENALITPDQVDAGIRGAGNWSREVRKVCWSDNTTGNLLLAGETVVRSGNWATMPPHRHQHDNPGVEAPYEEVYYFRFSHPNGFGLIWQFDDEGEMDQAFSLRTNDAAYMGVGYHPIVCAPGTTLYQLTLMAGPRRISQARVHPDYQYVLDAQGLENQYTPR